MGLNTMISLLRSLICYGKEAPGRVSYTTDVWTDLWIRPFMAITAHYFARVTNEDSGKTEDVWGSQLIAFRHLPESHTGEHLADSFLAVLESLGLVHKACIVYIVFLTTRS